MTSNEPGTGPSAVPPGGASNHPGLRVVIVDDSPDLRDLLRMTLERSGTFRVVGEAGTGRKGVDVVVAQRPDVVLLDVRMPDMDGLEALPLIRAQAPQTVVVMLSSLGSSTLTKRALADGADGYILKGRPLTELLAHVHVLVANRRAREPADSNSKLPGQLGAHAIDYLDQAPFGLLHIRNGHVVVANREADRVLGDFIASGAALADVAPPLARHLKDHLEDHLEANGPTTVTLGDPPRQVLTLVRPSGTDQLIYLQAEHHEQAELLRRAIATTAHEIRGPVGVLLGAAETVTEHDDELGSAERAHLMEVISRQTRLLERITADLLTAGQAQHGTLTPDLHELDAAELIWSVLPDDVDFVVVGDNLPPMVADPLRFQQMLGNLLSNAYKYGQPPFLVRLSATSDHIRIDVEDNGPGVPPEFRPKLFGEYSRAPGTNAGGTGLGLFVVRALSQAHRGAVTYSPRTPHGSVFTLLLPTAQTSP